MPAIQLARLKLQAGRLRDVYSQPVTFVRELRDVLAFYGNYTHRPGQSGAPPPIMHAYNVPAPVIRQILQEIIPLVKADPAQAEVVIDQLWLQANLECRQLAITLLGMAPVVPVEPILQRLEKWLPNSEERLVEAVLNQGLGRLRREDSQSFYNLVRQWVVSDDWRKQQLGLRALVYPVQEGSFNDLPMLFQLIRPLVCNTISLLRPSLVRLVSALAHRSPAETAYFLKENLNFPDTPWLTRHVIQEFPQELQETLKSAMRPPTRR
jgi:hypothetical protein